MQLPSNSSENALALALMVIANWLMAHLVTDWVMPSEVQSACQTLLIAGLGWHFGQRRAVQAGQDAAAQRVLAAATALPDTNPGPVASGSAGPTASGKGPVT